MGILRARHGSCGFQRPNQSLQGCFFKEKIKLRKGCYQQNAKSLSLFFLSPSGWKQKDISLISEIKVELLTVHVNAEFYYYHISK